MRTRGSRLMLAGAVLLRCQGVAQVYETPMAGKWFPDDPAELRQTLERSFAEAERRAGSIPGRGRALVLVAPHAAIQYSGVVAASAYRLIDSPKTVIVLGFSHRVPVEGVAGVDADAYATPLGEVSINREVQEELGFPLAKPDAYSDHSLENQLPFLQYAAPEASIVPLYAGELSRAELAAAAGKLAARIAQGDVLVASSDFTHYGEEYGYTPFPLNLDTRKSLYRQAMMAFEEIGSIDSDLFDAYLAATGDTICGRQPVRLLLATLARLEEQTYLELTDFMTSGDLLRDYSTSVSYGALAFYPSAAFRVNGGDQQKLLASARATLDRFLADNSTAGVPVPEQERSPAILQKGGVFVTVRREGKLRGCIGTFVARSPLWDAVPDRTIAASADPRFPPLTTAEGPVTLEVSLLTPVKRIKNWRDYRLGRGAVLLVNGSGGTLLPQMATEMGWNSEEEFLRNLARKAGLEPDAYQHPDARLYVYEVQAFAEPAAEQ